MARLRRARDRRAGIGQARLARLRERLAIGLPLLGLVAAAVVAVAGRRWA